MAIVTGDRYQEKLVKFVEERVGALIEGSLVLKLNPAGLHYVQSRLEALHEVENLLAGAPIDYLRAYVSDLGDHRALEQLRRILRLLTALKVVSVLPPPQRDPTPLSLLPFGRLRVLELRGCDLSTSAARGLLGLRHTLEKITCHNSTDALRHVFSSRIVEIKDSLKWNRLSFVSCACNGLVLMDESLQLLPAVETLDLSRNKFSKVDNLRKCSKLKHLDLGFNNLRSVASFSEVSLHISKLVLRNNALTTLRGIENLRSLEALDLSCNIISSFSEIEILVGLPSLQNLWLEGNPLCCARWYRAHVFSYFLDPHKLKLDDHGISNREFWKRQIIIASKHKRPSSFGFYFPANDDTRREGSVIKNKIKISRLASIESEEESTYVCSDQESGSCDDEIQSKEETNISENELEVADLINKIEMMKKERSHSWLHEFKDWMNHESENFVDGTAYNKARLQFGKENSIRNNQLKKHLGENSRYATDSVQESEDESSINVLESDNSFVDSSFALNSSQRVGQRGFGRIQKEDLKGELNSFSDSRIYNASRHSNSSRYSLLGSHQNGMAENAYYSPLRLANYRSESQSSSAYPGSPPQYRADILHQRQILVEEILQLSAESYSVASSESDTSSSEDDGIPEIIPSLDQADNSVDETKADGGENQPSSSHYEKGSLPGHVFPSVKENGQLASDSFVAQTRSWQKPVDVDHYREEHINEFSLPSSSHGNEVDQSLDQEARRKRETKRKAKRRVISMLENDVVGSTEESQKTNCGLTDMENERMTNCFVENYFSTNIADSGVNETCKQYLHCSCILDPEGTGQESNVIMLLSSENKLYVLLNDVAAGGAGASLTLLDCQGVEDVREAIVGLGLQVVRLHTYNDAKYLFLTRGIEKSRQLFSMLQVFDTSIPNDKCILRSVEHAQVELFDKQLCGDSRASIFQYSMVHFWCDRNKEEWLSRSLFVIRGHLLICIENMLLFGSLSTKPLHSPYFTLDSCCSTSDITELVVETKDQLCVAVAFGTSMGVDKEVAGTREWKLKWYSEEGLHNFVALMNALHLDSSTSPLHVRYV